MTAPAALYAIAHTPISPLAVHSMGLGRRIQQSIASHSGWQIPAVGGRYPTAATSRTVLTILLIDPPSCTACDAHYPLFYPWQAIQQLMERTVPGAKVTVLSTQVRPAAAAGPMCDSSLLPSSCPEGGLLPVHVCHSSTPSCRGRTKAFQVLLVVTNTLLTCLGEHATYAGMHAHMRAAPRFVLACVQARMQAHMLTCTFTCTCTRAPPCPTTRAMLLAVLFHPRRPSMACQPAARTSSPLERGRPSWTR